VNDVDMIDPRLDAHLRRTLNEVAATVPSGRAVAHTQTRRRVALPVMIALAVMSLGAGAFAWAVQSGHEYVKQLPPVEPIVSGTAGGIRWWLVPSFHTDVCGAAMPGVEVVTDARNRSGKEWDTFGVNYGEPSADPCARDAAAWLRDPTRTDAAISRMGDHDDPQSPWIGVVAIHPSASVVVVTVDGSRRRVPTYARRDQPNGPRYAIFTATAKAKMVSFVAVAANGAQIAHGVFPPRT
jgi:hypothetical protein